MTAIGVGHVIDGRYRVTHRLGRGGMGVVFGANDLKLDRSVAVKVLLEEYSAKDEFRRRFEREVLVASRLNHPNVVAVHDRGEVDGALYLVMERLRGATLGRVAAAAADGLPFGRVLDFATRLADVLVSAHDVGLVHRDLKPDNIFIERLNSESERLVVLDFGLAFVEGDALLGRMTATGNVSGTPQYLAPEQALGRTLTGAVDIYALGCILFELGTGRLPFEDDSSFALLNQHVYGTPTPMGPLTLRDDVPPMFERLTMACLRKSPSERPDAREVLELLTAIAKDPESRGRARGRDATVDRSERMITLPERPTDRPSPVPSPRSVVAVVDFPFADEWERALAVNGLFALTATRDELVAGELVARVVFAPWLRIEDIEAYRATGALVVAATEAGDMERTANLLRAGVAEIIVPPYDGVQVAHKLQRILRRTRVPTEQDDEVS